LCEVNLPSAQYARLRSQFVPVHATKACGAWRHSSTHS